MFKLLTDHRGFTLVEATVAIAILMLGFFSVIQFFPFGLQIISDSQNVTTASSIALSKIEALSSLNYEDLSPGVVESKQPVSNDSTSYLSHYQRQTVVETVDSDFNSSVSDIGFKKITVTVYWISPVGKREKSTQLATIITDY